MGSFIYFYILCKHKGKHSNSTVTFCHVLWHLLYVPVITFSVTALLDAALFLTTMSNIVLQTMQQVMYSLTPAMVLFLPLLTNSFHEKYYILGTQNMSGWRCIDIHVFTYFYLWSIVWYSPRISVIIEEISSDSASLSLHSCRCSKVIIIMCSWLLET